MQQSLQHWDEKHSQCATQVCFLLTKLKLGPMNSANDYSLLTLNHCGARKKTSCFKSLNRKICFNGPSPNPGASWCLKSSLKKFFLFFFSLEFFLILLGTRKERDILDTQTESRKQDEWQFLLLSSDTTVTTTVLPPDTHACSLIMNRDQTPFGCWLHELESRSVILFQQLPAPPVYASFFHAQYFATPPLRCWHTTHRKHIYVDNFKTINIAFRVYKREIKGKQLIIKHGISR